MFEQKSKLIGVDDFEGLCGLPINISDSQLSSPPPLTNPVIIEPVTSTAIEVSTYVETPTVLAPMHNNSLLHVDVSVEHVWYQPGDYIKWL